MVYFCFLVFYICILHICLKKWKNLRSQQVYWGIKKMNDWFLFSILYYWFSFAVHKPLRFPAWFSLSQSSSSSQFPDAAQSRGCCSVQSSERSRRVWGRQHWILYWHMFQQTNIFSRHLPLWIFPQSFSQHTGALSLMSSYKKPFISLMFILISIIIYLAQ